jgi:DNA-binding NtrC family response regulator
MHELEFPRQPVLIVDDEENALRTFKIILNSAKITNIVLCQDSRQVPSLLQEQEFETILLDLTMPHITGEELLPQIIRDYPKIPVIIITGNVEIDTAVKCMRVGAFDYMVKPVEEKRLISGVQRAIERNRLQRENLTLKRQLLGGELTHPQTFAPIVTQNSAVISIFKYIEVIAPSPEPVLLTGETGTGKELIARAIHDVSGREGAFIPVNVAGLDDTIFSDTLFGHKKGAFTDAYESRGGLIEQAFGGTLFLDEIGDLNPASQVKLLRLLQEREYFPLGSDIARYTDARIVTATNQDLEKLMETGTFRKDLYYRLEVHKIHIPPLRQRKDDIVMLVAHFLEEAAKALDKKKPTPPKELFILLGSYPFPGNIRELRGMVFDAVSSHTSGILSLDTFKQTIKQKRKSILPGIGKQTKEADKPILSQLLQPLPTLEQWENLLIKEAIKQTEGNQSMAAQLLGISRQTLLRKLKKS